MASFYDLIMGQRLPQQEGAAGYSPTNPPYGQFPLWGGGPERQFMDPSIPDRWPPGPAPFFPNPQQLPDVLPPNAFDMWGQGDMPVIHPWMIWPERYGLPGNRRP